MTHPIHTAFSGGHCLASGPAAEIAALIRAERAARPDAALLVLDDATGRVVDIDPRAPAPHMGAAGSAVTEPEAPAEAPQGRGRPKLGVVAREVTLLPRHWDWLAAQPGGASAELRRLVEAARRRDEAGAVRRAAQEAADRAMLVLAGDRPGYEEATRALYAGDAPGFEARLSGWPADIAAYVRRLAGPAFG